MEIQRFGGSRLKIVHFLVVAVGVGFPPLRDFVLIGNFDDSEKFFLLMAVVNTLSLLPTSVLLSRNVNEFPDHLDYFAFPLLCSFGVVVCWPIMDSHFGAWPAAVIAISVVVSILNGFISHLLVSGGQFYVARFSHIPHVFVSFCMIFFLFIFPIAFDGASLLLMSTVIGSVIYLGYFIFAYSRIYSIRSVTLKFLSKPGISRTRSVSTEGLRATIILYLVSVIPVAMNHLGQVVLISKMESSTYDLFAIRVSFYLSALLLFPFGYFVGKGKSGPINASKPGYFLFALVACGCALTLNVSYAPYLFCVGVVLLRYSGRSIVANNFK